MGDFNTTIDKPKVICYDRVDFFRLKYMKTQ